MTFYPAMSVASFDNGIPYDAVYDNSGPSNQPLYEGSAIPGTADTVGVLRWRIKKFFYDGNGQIAGWRWANGTTDFIFDWTLRAGYTYASL